MRRKGEIKTSRGRRKRSLGDVDAKTLNAVSLFLRGVASRYTVSQAILFGSRARGTHRSDSDIDVAILLHGPPDRFVATKLNMADLAYDVLLDTGMRIQPLPIWEEEWEHPATYSNPGLLSNIAKEGVRPPIGKRVAG